jgi:signal transduction histidine kinase
MNRKFLSFLSLLLLLLLQADSSAGQTRMAYPLVLHALEDTGRNLSVQAVWQQYQAGQFSPLKEPALTPGFSTSVFWVALAAKDLPAVQDLQLVADNAHINRLEWYSITKGAIALLAVTGDFYPFRQRPVNYNVFAFPLAAGPEVYLLKIDKHHESLKVNFVLQTQEELIPLASEEALVNGLLTGIVILIMLFGLFLFITTRDQVYLWYALYVLCVTLWIWADKGLGFHYLWPGSAFFPSRSRPLFSLCNIVVSIQFLQLFTKMERTGWYYRPLKILQAIVAVLVLLVLLPIPYQDFSLQTMFFLRVVPAIALAVIIIEVVYLVQQSLAKSIEARTYLLAISIFTCCAVAESLYHLGIVILPVYFEHYGMFTGIVLEMVVITFGMALRFNSYRREREVLLVQMNAQQKQLTDTIIAVQENERKVLADQLHDELGSMLSLASLNISALPHDEKTDQAAGMLQLVSHTVRNISHQLTPVAIEKYGFRHAVEDLVRMANTSGKISIELVLIGFEQQHTYPVNFRNTLYRIIQELLQNVIKHAAASHALVQVVEHDDTVGLLVEDNGRGIDTSVEENSGPAFMRSIQSKVDYLEGRMSIESAAGQGTLVNIEVPLPGKIIA